MESILWDELKNFVSRVLLAAGVSSALLCAGDTYSSEPREEARAEAKAAVEKALPLLQNAAEGHVAKKTCFACHNQTPSMLAITAASERGFTIKNEDLSKQMKFVAEFLDRNRENFKQGKGTGGQVDSAGAALFTLELGRWKPDATTEAVVEYLLLRDKNADHWRPASNRPPTVASPFTTNYLAIRALKKWGAEAQKDRIDARIETVRVWLQKATVKDTEDRVFRLFALEAVSEPVKNRQPAIEDLLRSQRKEGGWGQLDSMDSDAYATGSALVALHQAGGLATDDPVYQRGVAFLIKNQFEDGSWHVRTRSKPIQTYFESGFPHGKDQFVSVAASGWATTALTLSLAPAKQTSPEK